MNDFFYEDPAVEPVILPDGSLQCGNVVHEPWPSLRIKPLRSLGFMSEILRAQPGSAFWHYTQAVPKEIFALARAMPCAPFSSLELCGADPERGRDMLEHCPALAGLIIASYSRAKFGDRRAYFAAALKKPWREIVAGLDLPPVPGTVRVLSKLPRDQCRAVNLRRLCDVLRRKDHRWRHVLPHLPMVTADTLTLLSLDPKMVSPRLLFASSKASYDEEPVSWTLSSIQSLRKELNDSQPWPYSGLDFEALKLVEGRLTDLVHPGDAIVFPAPPIPGRQGEIVPLEDWESLTREADGQNNCALTFVAGILSNSAYLYKILRPERATLALTRNAENDAWSIHDLRAADNAEVSAATSAFVRAWFDQNAPRRN